VTAAIEADPTVARCLTDGLGAWEALAVHTLQARAQSTAVADVLSLRHAADTLRAARALNVDCAIGLDATAATINAEGQTMLDAAINIRSWAQVALLARELILIGGDGARASVQARINADLHAQVSGSNPLDLARAAYLLADDADAITAAARVSSHTAISSDMDRHQLATACVSGRGLQRRPAPTSITVRKQGGSALETPTVGANNRTTRTCTGAPYLAPKAKKTKKRKKPPVKKKASPKPTPKPTPTPTSTPRPKTLTEVLSGGIVPIKATVSGGNSISWAAIPGAARYVVTAQASGELVWSWAGSATGISFGDTSIDGMTGTSGDSWPVPLPGAVTWSVLALNSQGTIMGAAFRVQ
jgi:cell division septation protein DedD